jgi:hypothetical protein
MYFNNVDELEKRINQVENNPENYLELKDKAFNRVKHEYSWNKIVGQYYKLFTQNQTNTKASPINNKLCKNQKQSTENLNKHNQYSK